MQFGTVKSFKAERGYGFIIPDEGQSDVFVHVRDLCGIELSPGQRVAFNLRETDKGLRASNVIILLGPAQEEAIRDGRDSNDPASAS